MSCYDFILHSFRDRSRRFKKCGLTCALTQTQPYKLFFITYHVISPLPHHYNHHQTYFISPLLDHHHSFSFKHRTTNIYHFTHSTTPPLPPPHTEPNVHSPLNIEASELWSNEELYKKKLHEHYKAATDASRCLQPKNNAWSFLLFVPPLFLLTFST